MARSRARSRRCPPHLPPWRLEQHRRPTPFRGPQPGPRLLERTLPALARTCPPPVALARPPAPPAGNPRRAGGGDGDRCRRDAAGGQAGHPGADAAAAPRGHHQAAGGREGPRPGAARGDDLPGVEVPGSDLVGGREGADADPAVDGAVHRPQVGRHGVRAARPGDAADQHLLRRLVPALPDRPLRRERHAGGGRLQRGRAQRRRLGRAGRRRSRLRPEGGHPVPGDARVRGERDPASEAVPVEVRARARAGLEARVDSAQWTVHRPFPVHCPPNPQPPPRASRNSTASLFENSSPYTAPSRLGASIAAASASPPASTCAKPMSLISFLTVSLASSSSPQKNIATRSSPERPAAAPWKPAVSVLNAFTYFTPAGIRSALTWPAVFPEGRSTSPSGPNWFVVSIRTLPSRASSPISESTSSIRVQGTANSTASPNPAASRTLPAEASAPIADARCSRFSGSRE